MQCGTGSYADQNLAKMSRSTAAICFVAFVCSAAATDRDGATHGPFAAQIIKTIEERTSVRADPLTYLSRVVVVSKNGNASTIRGEICAYPSAPREKTVGKAYAFHAVVNCKAAEWTVNVLHNLIKSSPLLYQHKFLAPEWYDDEIKRHFQTNLECFASDFWNNADGDRLTNALARLLDVAAFGSRQSDTAAVLKTLLSLTAKTLHAKKTYDARAHYAIVRSVLEDMIRTQRFLAMNCPSVTADEHNSQLYGFWIPPDDRSVRAEVAKVLDAVDRDTGARPHPLQCTVEWVLSTRFIDVKATDDVTVQEMADVLVVTQTGTVTVKTLLERADVVLYDVDAIFWCYESAVMAIMKLVVGKIRMCARSRDDPMARLIDVVKSKIHKISENMADSPKYFVDGFTILSKLIDRTNSGELKDQLDDYYDSLVGVQLDWITGEGDEQSSETCDDDYIKSINKNLEFVLNKTPDLKCFNHFFKPMHLERDKYYAPFTQNKQFLHATEDADNFANGCDFVKSIYSVSYKAFFLFNKYIDTKPKDKKLRYLQKSLSVIRDIKNYSLIITKKGTNNAAINKNAFDIATILVNLPLKTERVSLEFEVKRVLNVIMNEMNSFDIKYCSLTNPVFLIFNKINFYEFGDKDTTNESLYTFLENNLCNFTIDDLDFNSSINDVDYQYLSVKFFYETFIENSVSYKTYEIKIKVNWKGSVQTLEDIFKSELLLILNPLHFYELYDVYFKYCAAIIFYPIRRVLFSTSKLKHIKNNFEKITLKLNKHNWITMFPQEMKYFLLDIDRLLKLPNELTGKNPKIKDNEVIGELREIKKNIEKKFSKFNVVFKSTSKVVKCFFRRRKIDLEKYTNVFEELMKNLELVFINFSNIYTPNLMNRYNKCEIENQKEDISKTDLNNIEILQELE